MAVKICYTTTITGMWNQRRLQREWYRPGTARHQGREAELCFSKVFPDATARASRVGAADPLWKAPRQITGIYDDTGARQGFSYALRSVIWKERGNIPTFPLWFIRAPGGFA